MAHRPALGAALDHTVWPRYWAAQHSSDLAVSGQPYSTRQTATSQSGPVSRAVLAFPVWETELTRAGQGGALDRQDTRFHPSQPPAGQAGPFLGPSHLALCLPGFEHRPGPRSQGVSQGRASPALPEDGTLEGAHWHLGYPQRSARAQMPPVSASWPAPLPGLPALHPLSGPPSRASSK